MNTIRSIQEIRKKTGHVEYYEHSQIVGQSYDGEYNEQMYLECLCRKSYGVQNTI